MVASDSGVLVAILGQVPSDRSFTSHHWLFPYLPSGPLAQGSQMSRFCSQKVFSRTATRHDGPSVQCRSPVKPALLGAPGPAWSFICTCQSSALECPSPPLPVKFLPALSPKKPVCTTACILPGLLTLEASWPCPQAIMCLCYCLGCDLQR